MPQAILPRTYDSRYIENGGSCEMDIQKYQVDTISISSIQDGQESEEEEEDYDDDNAVVVGDHPSPPHFGSVSVVNSNDVHFGNKTVYKGPVTIKQFVYPNNDVNSDIVNGLNDLVKKIEFGQQGEVINGGFVKDGKEVELGNAYKEVEAEERGQEADDVSGRFRKGVKWIKTVPCKKPRETILFLFVLMVSVTTITAVVIWKSSTKVIKVDNYEDNHEEDNNSPIDYTSESDISTGKLRIINRLIWLAQPPSGPMNALKLPVSLVIIQHTATVNCTSQAACIFQTRHIQTFHMESNNWNDIGYNFLIGGDGAVYEGRGWLTEGAHTLGWNNVSIGVAFIGTYNSEIPSSKMLMPFKKLLEKGVELGHLTKDYKVMGARQFSGTESPGKTFYELIKTWSHWSDLKNLKLW